MASDDQRNQFSRAAPSPRYRALLAIYRNLHDRGQIEQGIPADQTFDGRALYTEIHRIGDLFRLHDVRSVLDYGCGKALLHKGIKGVLGGVERIVTTRDLWGIADIDLYDPGYAPFERLPQRTYDAVISTDMLEHIPAEDVPWVLEEMFGFAEKLVFATIACYPAVKTLPNGENAHCTVRPPSWWRDRIAAAAARRPGVRYYMIADTTGNFRKNDPFSGRIGEEIIAD